MTDFKIGRVTNYYDKIQVAVVELDGSLALGDKIKFVRGGEDIFEQEVETIQVGHKKVKSAGKGEIVGLNAAREVKQGAEIYKTEIT